MGLLFPRGGVPKPKTLNISDPKVHLYYPFQTRFRITCETPPNSQIFKSGKMYTIIQMKSALKYIPKGGI